MCKPTVLGFIALVAISGCGAEMESEDDADSAEVSTWTNRKPRGFVFGDGVRASAIGTRATPLDACTVSGWALDDDTPNINVKVVLTFDDRENVVLTTGVSFIRYKGHSVIAQEPLFWGSVPARYRDGKPHTVRVTVVDTANFFNSANLGGFPFTCT